VTSKWSGGSLAICAINFRFFFQAEDGIRGSSVTGVQTCALPICLRCLNWEAVGHLFTFLATPPAQSIVDGVRKLEPARIAIAGRSEERRVGKGGRTWTVPYGS